MLPHARLIVASEQDAWIVWRDMREVEAENLERWLAELDNYPIPEFREIGHLLRQAVALWDKTIEVDLAKIPEHRRETYERSLPMIVQYLCYRLYHLARLSGAEIAKACISCGKPFFSYRSAVRFCSPRCFSVYELFLRQLNTLFEIIREQHYPSREAWKSCIICGNRVIRWYKTRAGGWKLDWVNSLVHPRGVTKDRQYRPDYYKQVCISPFCNWAAANLRKIVMQKEKLSPNEVEERQQRFQKWIEKMRTQEYTPHLSMLKAQLETIADAVERALIFYGAIYIIFGGKLPHRYRLFNDPNKQRRAALACMHVSLLPRSYTNLYFDFFKELITQDAPAWLDNLLRQWRKAVVNPEVALVLPSEDPSEGVIRKTLAMTFALLETTPTVALDNNHYSSEVNSISQVEELLYSTIMDWVGKHRDEIEAISQQYHQASVKNDETDSKKAETEGDLDV